MKCDEKEKSREAPFKPESPLVIVCEGFQDAGFICALLKHLKIGNCDVTYPKKKRDGQNGKDGMASMVSLLVGDPVVKGIALIRDADEDPDNSFKEACVAFSAPFRAPKKCFSVESHGSHSSAVFLIPGKGKMGAIETLLLDAVFAVHKDLAECIDKFEMCRENVAKWSDKKKSKMKMQSVIASFCHDDPGCSLGFIWSKGKDNPIDISNPAFEELSAFLKEFSAVT